MPKSPQYKLMGLLISSYIPLSYRIKFFKNLAKTGGTPESLPEIELHILALILSTALPSLGQKGKIYQIL